MSKINVMVNGLPGNVADVIARHVAADERFTLMPYSLTGPEIDVGAHRVAEQSIRLIPPDGREAFLQEIASLDSTFIGIDFTHPSAVNDNARFYCAHAIPFVMGTTGGNRQEMMEAVEHSDIAAVIAPNMAKQIVGFQAMMTWAAENFPGLFNGYTINMRESHQMGKADTSGTAKAMMACFKRLGVACTEADIQKERDPLIQEKEWGIPKAYLTGHGWHTYTLTSGDQTVKFEFTHNVNGREIYGQGTLDAIAFLHDHIAQGARGKVFSMMDVLKGYPT